MVGEHRLVIGWDVSTSAIGVCVLWDVPHFHVIFPKGETHLEKWNSAASQIGRFLQETVLPEIPEYGPDTLQHIIEQRLGGFSGGSTSSQTLMALAAMNAVVSHSLSCQGRVTHILPITTKRIMGLTLLPGEDKKDAVVRLARSSCPNFPYRETKSGNWVKGTDDMADAWLLAQAGMRVLRGEASLGSTEKARRGKGQARGAKAGRKKKG